MSTKEHIMVIVPTYDRWVTDSVAAFFGLAAHKNYDPEYPFKFSVGTLSQINGYAAVRNRGAKHFLDSDFDRLWFIDNDTILPNDIFDLPKVDADIVTLPYPFVGTMTPAIVNYLDLDDFSKGMVDVEPGPDGIADVNGTGLGCTIIRRAVLENPGMHYPTTYTDYEGNPQDLKDDPDAAPTIFKFHRKPDGRWEMGEDYDFCIRAKKLGYSVKIRMKSICGHLKTIDLNEARERSLRSVDGSRADTRNYAIA